MYILSHWPVVQGSEAGQASHEMALQAMWYVVPRHSPNATEILVSLWAAAWVSASVRPKQAPPALRTIARRNQSKSCIQSGINGGYYEH